MNPPTTTAESSLTRPTAISTVTNSATPTAALPATSRPAATVRVRYWEHMDPASKSLYPVD
ncbi:hypothetical protein GCM10027048_19810 [Hymenobacter coalescens]